MVVYGKNNKKMKQVNRVIACIQNMAKISGFRIKDRIVLVDIKTGEEYR